SPQGWHASCFLINERDGGRAPVPLWDRKNTKTGAANMMQDGSLALFQYWNRLRGGRTAPRRIEIEPADIKTLLADTFILERDARGRTVFRLAGTRLCATYGKELKGHSFPSLWAGKDQDMAGRLVRHALEDGNVALVTF